MPNPPVANPGPTTPFPLQWGQYSEASPGQWYLDQNGQWQQVPGTVPQAENLHQALPYLFPEPAPRPQAITSAGESLTGAPFQATPYGGGAPLLVTQQGPISNPAVAPNAPAAPTAQATDFPNYPGTERPPRENVRPGTTTSVSQGNVPPADPSAKYRAIAAANGVDWEVLNKVYAKNYPDNDQGFYNALSHAVSDGIFAKIANKYDLGLNDRVWNDYASGIGNRSLIGESPQKIREALENTPLRGHSYAIDEFIQEMMKARVITNPVSAGAATSQGTETATTSQGTETATTLQATAATQDTQDKYQAPVVQTNVIPFPGPQSAAQGAATQGVGEVNPFPTGGEGGWQTHGPQEY